MCTSNFMRFTVVNSYCVNKVLCCPVLCINIRLIIVCVIAATVLSCTSQMVGRLLVKCQNSTDIHVQSSRFLGPFVHCTHCNHSCD